MERTKKEEIVRLKEAYTRQTTRLVTLRNLVKNAPDRKARIAQKIEELQHQLVAIDEEVAKAPGEIATLEKWVAACQRKLRIVYLGPKVEQLQKLAAKLKEMGVDPKEVV